MPCLELKNESLYQAVRILGHKPLLRHGSCRKNVKIITYISEATSVTSAFDRVLSNEAYNIVRDVYT